jgi:glycosyltransferase involved in cell wall biosynthesis
MKKICFVISSLSGGGAEKVVLTLAEVLSEMGNEIHIILVKNKIEYEINLNHYKIHSLSKTGRLSNIRQFNQFLLTYKLKNLIKKEEIKQKFDLVISNLVDADKLCSKLSHENLYFCIHSDQSVILRKKSFFKRLRTVKRYKNKNIITVSEGIKNNFLNILNIKPKSIQTIYNPFNIKNIINLSTLYKIEKNDSFIIHVGRFMSVKRHDILLKAYKKSNIQEKLVLLGDGEKRKEIVRLIKELKLENKVILKGFVRNPYPYIKESKLLILSSDYEGFGNVLAEALILNTMIISTNCPSGPQEILIDELTQFLSPVGDIDLLSENIKKAINNPIEITEKYTQKFESKVIATQYMKLCK